MTTINDQGVAKLSQRQQSAEVAVFLLLIVPSMALSFLAVRQGGLSFPLVAVSVILRDLALVSLILYFLWRNGEPVGYIGWRLTSFRKDAVLGLLLFPLVFFGAALLNQALVKMGLSTPKTPLPSMLAFRGVAESLLAFVLVVVVAIAEETIFRGYLILRFAAVTRSPLAAVLLSSIVFSIGHGYEGSAGVVTVGTMGLVFAIVYLWRRSLVAPVTMHFLQDFLAIVLLPALGAK